MKKRIPQFDITRTIAILCVILCHCTESVYDFNNINSFGLPTRFFVFTLFTAGRIGVPLFLFLSGALLLKKQVNNDEDVLKFYKNSLIPLFCANIIWTLIYNLFFWLTGRTDYVSLGTIIKEILCMQQIPSPQMWYLPMIIGLYLGIPFLAKIIKSFSFKSFLFLLIPGLLNYFGVPFINLLLRIMSINHEFSTFLYFALFGGTYAIYLCAGYFLTVYKDQISKYTRIIYTVSIISFISAVLIQILAHARGMAYNIWYNDPLLLISSAGLFIRLNNLNEAKLNQQMITCTCFISKISFSIFLIHQIVMHYIRIHVMLLNIPSPFKVMLFSLLTALVSMIVSYLFTKCRFISKYAILHKE